MRIQDGLGEPLEDSCT
ncbi:hypothetical protein LINGRAHAP2_LOCUS24992 [Linum grandiflorum]